MSVVSLMKNKHVVIAMLVTPVLAVLAWFAVGWFMGGDLLMPQKAEPGQSYPLVEQSGCRYGGGICRLRNEDFQLEISRLDQESAGLRISSVFPLDSLLLGLVNQGPEAPTAARQVGDNPGEWQLELAQLPGSDDRLRLIAMRAGVMYFGEAGFTWLEPNNR
ncbi:hypothetical protein [Luminiphilus syltensis]|uniref:hypothetical protein n=1 Tax=Luminiphilus syltensis TaxID=1341119 RepID=UPI00030C1A26|nr:hypothetical protein [Luminiphilus syltensis]